MIRRRAAIFLMIGAFLLLGSGCATSPALPSTGSVIPLTSNAATPTSTPATPTSGITPLFSTPATSSPTPSMPTAVALLAWIHSNRQTEAAPEPIYEVSRDTVTLHFGANLDSTYTLYVFYDFFNEFGGDRQQSGYERRCKVICKKAVSWFVVGVLVLAGLCLPAFVPAVPPALAGNTTIQLWIGQKDITVDGQTQPMDVVPFIQNGRTLVPVRFISEALGAKVDWIDANKEIVIVLGAKVVGLWIGKDTATVNGVESKLEAPPIIQDSRTFVPLRFVSEALGAKVDWLQEKSQVNIAYSAPQLILPTATDTVWHYMVIGDSEAWGFYDYYAQHLEADLGAKVEIISYALPGLDCAYLLEKVKTSTRWRMDLAQAEVITFEANPTPHIGWYIINGPGSGDQHSKDFSDTAFDAYQADMEAVLSEILTLRKGQPTLIRAQNLYCPIYSDWKKMGIYEECQAAWTRLNQSLEQAAAKYGVPTADIYSAFNGPNHDEDPVEKGLIGIDGEHVSTLGYGVMADIFRRLGYQFIVP